jgi:hypothetical protein
MRRNNLSWLGTVGLVILAAIIAAAANPAAALAATHTILAENGSATW